MATKSWSTVVDNGSQSAVSLADVMSEQLIQEEVKEVEELDEKQLIEDIRANYEDIEEYGASSSAISGETSCDQLLAQLLQREFDREHDKHLKREENHLNQNSKVALSYQLFRRQPGDDSGEDSEEEFEFGEQSRDWDSFERSQRLAPKVGAKGFARDASGKWHTKHDPVESARKNARKVMDFELETGDGGGFDMQLNNHVFNALKVHSISEGKRMARLHEKKEKSTADKVLDHKSRILLYKLVNRGVLDQINGAVATGKESVVLHGQGRREDAEEGEPMEEVAIKVFKTTLNEFKNRLKYIEKDPILEQTSKLSKQNPKLMIPLWAEKEMHNLNRMRRAGILCPRVVLLRKHVLVMSFIGSDGRPAPTLKQHLWQTEDELRMAWNQCQELMHVLYNTCQLVHADLSEYNLLWHETRVHCIDVSQSVFTTHPMAKRFLFRDCHNIHRFFAKHCLTGLPSVAELFTKICGQSLDSSAEVDLLDQMANYDKSEELLKYAPDGTHDPFEEMYARARQETRDSK